MIKNINYRGAISLFDLDGLNIADKFNRPPPHQVIIPIKYGDNCNVKLLIFSSGKCRLMGMTEELDESKIPFKINDLQMQSATMVIDLGYKINLIKLSKTLPRHYFMYEPELFPALRLILFNPMCVNVFSTGKVVVLGLKKLTNQNALSQQIRSLLGVYIDRDNC